MPRGRCGTVQFPVRQRIFERGCMATYNGTTGNDYLFGGNGADTLVGGAGDDVYFVNNARDVIVESANQGNDLVWSSVSYTLGANVESLTLYGSALNATGNSLNNILIGTSGANRLDGGA